MSAPSRGGFRVCSQGVNYRPVLQGCDRSLVIAALVVHAADVISNFFCSLLFFRCELYGVLAAILCIMFGCWIITSLYDPLSDDDTASLWPLRDDIPAKELMWRATVGHIFREAGKILSTGGHADHFYSLRLLGAVLGSAPIALVQLYSLMCWDGFVYDLPGAAFLLQISVVISIVSVGMALATWEYRLQPLAGWCYISGVGLLRVSEVASRTISVAMFAALTYPDGLLFIFVIDYCFVLLLLIQHQNVRLRHAIFVALPLFFVSLEPFVWRAQDHAVPKMQYYTLRLLEFLFFLGVCFPRTVDEPMSGARAGLRAAWEMGLVASTVIFVAALPFVSRLARRFELTAVVDVYGDDDRRSSSTRSGDKGLISISEEGSCSEEDEEERMDYRETLEEDKSSTRKACEESDDVGAHHGM